MKIKFFLAFILCLIVGLFFVENSAAKSLNNFSFPFVLKSSIAGLNPYEALPPQFNPKPTITTVLCQIRCWMSSDVGYVLVALTIFTNGLLILAHKMTWGMAVLTLVLIIMFTQADELAQIITKSGLFGPVFSFISDFSCNCLLTDLNLMNPFGGKTLSVPGIPIPVPLPIPGH